MPSKKVYEDDEILGFHDIHPQAPVHFMLMPKKHIASLADATAEDAGVLGRMMAMSGQLAREQGSPDGFRTIVNSGRIGLPGRDAPAYARHRRPEPLGRMLPRLKRAQGPKEKDHGWIEHLALADRAAGRRADIRHQEAAQHRAGPRWRGQGLQGRHEDDDAAQTHPRRAPRRTSSGSRSAGRRSKAKSRKKRRRRSDRVDVLRAAQRHAATRPVPARCST